MTVNHAHQSSLWALDSGFLDLSNSRNKKGGGGYATDTKAAVPGEFAYGVSNLGIESNAEGRERVLVYVVHTRCLGNQCPTVVLTWTNNYIPKGSDPVLRCTRGQWSGRQDGIGC